MKMKILVVALMIASSASAADLEKGKQAYAARCSSCHGLAGEGDGAVGKALPPGTVTNLVKGPFKKAKDAATVKELIKKGGAAMGLNAMMPPAPTIADDELENLAQFVLSLRKS